MSNTKPKTTQITHKDEQLSTYLDRYGDKADSAESELSLLTDNIVYLEDYSSLVVGDDWTQALQVALNTGKDIKGTTGKTYKVSGVLKSKGQKLIGDWYINPTHVTHATEVKASVSFDKSGKIRLIYMAVHYDLCELLVIKSLGFNTVSHYTNFVGHPSGAGGSIPQLLNNAATAGLLMHIDIDQGMEKNNLTMQQLVELCDSYEATWGYSVYDEPGTRDISLQLQDARITTLRSLTNKVLTTVDLVVQSNPPFYQRVSYNYDYVFVDSYAQRYSSGTEQDKRDWDMEKSRIDVGGMMALTQCPNILYVGGLFIDHSSGGQYTQNKQQGIDHSLNFLTKGGGEYGLFIWDMPWDSQGDDCIYNSLDYQRACLKLSKQVYGNKHRTDHYIFGSAPTYADFGLGDLMANLPVKDPNNKQQLPWSDAYPANTFVSSSKYSGIGFKNETASFATTIPCRKYVSVYLDGMSTTGSFPSACKLQLKGYNGEVTRPITPEFPIGTKQTFYNSSKWDGDSRREQLGLTITGGITDSEHYSLLVRGLIVCSDW